jgi:S1-C subfamily serine protease
MKIKLPLLLFLVIQFSACFGQSNSPFPGPATGSTVLLLMYDENHKALPLGNGFVIGENQVATSFHVIENSASGFVVLNDKSEKYKIAGVISKNEKMDIAVLAVEQLGIFPAKLASKLKFEFGDKVRAISNPSGTGAKVSPGIINGVVDLKPSKLSSKSDTMIQITSFVTPRCNGGPVINEKGDVIGVAVTIIKTGMTFGFTVPVTYLQELLSVKPKGDLSFKKSKRSKSSLLDKDWSNYLREAVTGMAFKFDSNPNSGFYTFSVRNNLIYPIRNIKCLVIFYDSNQLPIESEIITLDDPIGPKMAKRIEKHGRMRRGEVRDLTHWTEVRILAFEIDNFGN